MLQQRVYGISCYNNHDLLVQFYPFLQRLEVPAILSFPDLTEILNYILDIDT